MNIKKTLYLISGGVLIGTFMGLIASIHTILSNRYLQYKMYKITALIFQKNVTYSIVIAIAGLAGLYLLSLLLVKIMKINKIKVIHLYEILFIISVISLFIDLLLREFADLTLIYGLKDFKRMLFVYSDGKITFEELLSGIKEHLTSYFVLFLGGVISIPLLYMLMRRLRIDRISEFFQKINIMKTAIALFSLVIILNVGLVVEDKMNATKDPNVIFIVVDALRADHVSCYGYEKLTTPNIDKLCSDGIMFKKAISQGNRTSISMPSMFTGLYTSDQGYLMSRKLEYRYAPLSDKVMTITEILKNAGYATHAVSCQPWVSPDSGFGQGFDNFEIISSLYDNLSDQKTIYRATEWLNSNFKKKFFLYINLMGPHTPYSPPPPYDILHSTEPENKSKLLSDLDKYYRQKKHLEYYKLLMGINKENISEEDLNKLIRLYDGKITFTDLQIGHLIERLKELKIYNNTLIVLTADHGEAFLEHNKLLHGTYLYNEEIHVPLIMTYQDKLPKGIAVDDIVQLVDIFPTVTRIADISTAGIKMRGAPLYPLTGSSYYSAPFAYSEGSFSYKKGSRLTKYMDNKWSLICNNNTWECELYDLENDPKETRNLIENKHDIALDMKNRLFALIDNKMHPSLDKIKTVRIPEKTKKTLKSLGYLQ